MEQEAQTPPPNIVAVEAKALALRQELAAVEIVDQPTYDDAVEKRKAAKQWLDEAAEFFDGPISDAHALHKKLLQQKKDVCGPVEAALAQTNRALVTWDTEQERIRLAKERELREKAEADAREQALADAIHAEDQGASPEQVEAIMETPAPVTAPIVAPSTYQRSSAVTMRDSWSGEVTDLWALVKAVAKDKSKLNLLQPNTTAINMQARALKDTMNIPGIRAVKNRIPATGRG